MMNTKRCGIDRISRLPDEILTYILSFLSTRNAVQTCILSKRWINTWTSVPVLEFDIEELMPKTVDGKMAVKFVPKFELLVKSVLEKRDTTCIINRFRLSLGYLPCTQVVADCMSGAMKLRPRECSIKFRLVAHFNVNIDMIFTCASLIDLHMSVYTHLAIEPNSINLPCLKTLHLTGTISDDLFKKLFLGCPVLEELVLSYSMGISEISSNTLKKLVIYDLYEENKLQISTLNLVYFEIYIREIMDMGEILLPNMPSLVDAFISIPGWYDENYYISGIPKLIASFPNLDSLKLEFECTDEKVSSLCNILETKICDASTFAYTFVGIVLDLSTNSVEVGSNDFYVDEDENNPRIHMQSDLIDPYIYYEEAIRVVDEPLSNDISKPYVGMEFNTHEEAYTFYNNYALCAGFSVRKASSASNKNGLSSIRYVCSKEGKSEWHKRKERPIGCSMEFVTPEKEHGITRCDCKASFRIRKMGSGKWKVSVFEEDHKHELITSPSKIRNLRSHKLMTGSQKDTIRKLSAQNVGTTQIHEYMSAQYDGKGNIRFKKKDISNLIAGDNAKLIGVDVHTTLMYFKQKQDDPEFFYSILADEDGVVKNIFWVDGRGRRAYKEFGDVVTFDTTYQTNKYNMPFAPFIGVNGSERSVKRSEGDKSEKMSSSKKPWDEERSGKPKISLRDSKMGRNHDSGS
ncbi:uncharacterized protein LOC144548813 [Carex rostrata]